jgi:hypothetical protein
MHSQQQHRHDYLGPVIALSTLFCVSCGLGDEPAVAESETLTQAGERSMRFQANLSGEDEVPAVDTTARGEVLVEVTSGDELPYRLVVANIVDVVAAHIHCGAAGATGPVGVTLFMGGPVSTNGTLIQATATAPDDDNACGWAELAAVSDAALEGDAYVNVHTLAHPAGEIRGQLR